ncbi:Adenine deaminase [compost metagenome]
MKQLYAALRGIGAPDHFNPFLTLSFLALPVIPALKLTDRGLFDFASYSHIGIEAMV